MSSLESKRIGQSDQRPLLRVVEGGNVQGGLSSPWLTPPEAAAYCRMSLSSFNQKRRIVPIKNIGGAKDRPRYHVNALDRWMLDLYAAETQRIDEQAVDQVTRIELFPLKANEKRHRPRLLE